MLHQSVGIMPVEADTPEYTRFLAASILTLLLARLDMIRPV
jgi:hypothetical protein